MALTADLNRTAVTADGTESTWADETVYGGAELLRNQVAVSLTAYKVDVDQVETALEVSTFDPEDATTFTTENGADGWTKYYFVIIERWLVGTTYNQYDLVWSEDEQAFYEYSNATPSAGNLVTDSTYWTVVTDPTTKIANVNTASESGNLIYEVINKVLTYQTSICYIKAASKHAKETCGTPDCGCDSRLGKLFHKIRDLFNNMPLNESTGQYLEGEKNARLAEKWCDDCGCLTR
jgi:hypothetical protein